MEVCRQELKGGSTQCSSCGIIIPRRRTGDFSSLTHETHSIRKILWKCCGPYDSISLVVCSSPSPNIAIATLCWCAKCMVQATFYISRRA